MVLVGYNTLAVGRPGSFQIARSSNGLPELFTAIKAQDGTLWLGGAQGLFRFASPFRMEFWTARDGVDSPWCIRRAGNRIYAGLDRDVAILGTIVTTQNHLTASLQILFGTTPATLLYYGLAPSFTGLYQFNVTVPKVATNNLTPISFTLGGVKGTQTLYIAVTN